MEIVPEAIHDAIANARDNNIRNAEFLTGDAAKLMPQLYRKGLRPDVIVTDPPRAGCAPEVLKTLRLPVIKTPVPSTAPASSVFRKFTDRDTRAFH